MGTLTERARRQQLVLHQSVLAAYPLPPGTWKNSLVSDFVIPAELLPADGRFGSGPTKIRPEALHRLGAAHQLMGTSHRKAPVKNLVAAIQQKLTALYSIPDSHQVVLGNGGSVAFWDVAICSLIKRRSSHAVCGEFSRKFANAATNAPFLVDPIVNECPAGSSCLPTVDPSVDAYAWVQNETSTGAIAPATRLAGANPEALMLVDATSAAGGMTADIAGLDAYYFAPQKNFSSDGGLWLAICSQQAIERAAKLTSSPDGRWVPDSLNLSKAATNSAKHQTLNTPALATLFLLDAQLDWILGLGGLTAVIDRTTQASSQLYDWAAGHDFVTPVVTDPALRSPLVVTLQFDETKVDADRLCQILRANGIVDVEAYRGIGHNQMRIACYASIDPADITQLIAAMDWVLERITG